MTINKTGLIKKIKSPQNVLSPRDWFQAFSPQWVKGRMVRVCGVRVRIGGDFLYIYWLYLLYYSSLPCLSRYQCGIPNY